MAAIRNMVVVTVACGLKQLARPTYVAINHLQEQHPCILYHNRKRSLPGGPQVGGSSHVAVHADPLALIQTVYRDICFEL